VQTEDKIYSLWQSQREFYNSGITRDVAFRREALLKLREALHKWEGPLSDALWADLHKSPQEAYLTEFCILYSELDYHLKHLNTWTSDKSKRVSLFQLPSSGRIHWEPLGNTLIIAPWNYPIQLILNPLIGAISAGDTAVLKVSPFVPRVSGALAEMVAECFDSKYIAVVQGHRDVNEYLLSLRWDFIFFTGGTKFGAAVIKAASEHFTPVVLEMGGKSPCIVSEDGDVKTAARRIAWGKVVNAGQTCIAPDYALVHRSLYDDFIREFRNQVRELLGPDPYVSEYFGRIVNDGAFCRLKGYIDAALDNALTCSEGMRFVESERYIAPTLILNPDPESDVMTTEIFGPLLPVIPFSDLNQAISFVNGREKPLAMYIFSKKKTARGIISKTTSGGACVNDTIMHVAGETLPFGGVGNSGMGEYHGRRSFEVFSHQRSVLSTPVRMDLPLRYMPYKYISFVKSLMKK